MIVISLGSPLEFVFRPKIGVPSTFVRYFSFDIMSDDADHSPDRNNS